MGQLRNGTPAPKVSFWLGGAVLPTGMVYLSFSNSPESVFRLMPKLLYQTDSIVLERRLTLFKGRWPLCVGLFRQTYPNHKGG